MKDLYKNLYLSRERARRFSCKYKRDLLDSDEIPAVFFHMQRRFFLSEYIESRAQPIQHPGHMPQRRGNSMLDRSRRLRDTIQDGRGHFIYPLHLGVRSRRDFIDGALHAVRLLAHNM